MTTWSVVNDEPREKRWQDNFPRRLPGYALLTCLALVVVSLVCVAMLNARIRAREVVRG